MGTPTFFDITIRYSFDSDLFSIGFFPTSYSIITTNVLVINKQFSFFCVVLHIENIEIKQTS